MRSAETAGFQALTLVLAVWAEYGIYGLTWHGQALGAAAACATQARTYEL